MELSYQDRLICAKSLCVKFDLMDDFNSETNSTVQEMVECALKPYDPTNKFLKIDTLDRHSFSVYGNDQEVTLLHTLVHHDLDDCNQLLLSRDKHTQVNSKIDIVGNNTYQVKAARIGTYDELFINSADLEGIATYLAYVDAKYRNCYLIHRKILFEYIEEKEWKATDYWKHDPYQQVGRWMDLEFANKKKLVQIINIPSNIPATYYCHTSKQIMLTI